MKYERIRYPDGQISCKITSTSSRVVRERINSYEDLFFVRSLAEALSYHYVKLDNWTLIIPCLFGQRSDRRFSSDQSFDLKLIAEIINACKFGKVRIYDPHSDVALALIDRSEKIGSLPWVINAVDEIYKMWVTKTDLVLVSPDAGAYKKVFDYGEQLGCQVIAGVKHRAQDGQIDLQFMGDVRGKHCLIVDDICDGGATFIKLAEQLKQQGAEKVFLYVTHGYFSKGFCNLYKDISHIFCTNSVKDLREGQELYNYPGFVTQYKII